MKKLFLLLMLITGISYAFKSSINTIKKADVTFQIKNLGINTHGKIGGLKADIHIDPANLSAALIDASVETATINTDNDMRDEHLKGSDFFDVAKYPKITLRSVSVKHKSGDSYTGNFNLTIKNKTRPVDIPFTYTETGGDISFRCSFKINRLDYGVGSNSFTMGDQVTVNIDAEAAK